MAASIDGLSAELAITVYMEHAQRMRHFLEEDGYWDSSRRLQRLQGNLVAVPVRETITSSFDEDHFIKGVKEMQEKLHHLEDGGSILKSGCYRDIPCLLISVSLPPSKKQLAASPHQRLVNAVRTSFRELDIPFPEEIQKEIPVTWEKHGDLILLPQASFRSSQWEDCPDLWGVVARILGGQRVGRKGRVKKDKFRSPRVELLLGNDGWVEHRDNGIIYAYDIRHCMFSAGNITEKLRIAGLDCTGETVVDLYAGIGYFTLPFLVHAKASMVHACEWNPNAVTALRKNLALNNVQDRCIVHHGDNREVCPRGVADRVNLGLIPSSEEGWPVACAALKPQSGGVLHIHGNVTSHPQIERDRMHPAHNNAASPAGKRTANSPLISQDVCSSHSRTLRTSEEKMALTGFRTAGKKQTSDCNDRDIRQGKESSVKSSVTTQYELATEVTEDASRSSCSHTTNLSTFPNSGQNGEITVMQGSEENSSRLLATEKDLNLQDIGHTCSSEETADESSRTTTDGNSNLTAKDCWMIWANSTAQKVQELLADIHGCHWTTDVIHIEHVKSYAPHVDHIVADIRCKPKTTNISS